MPKKLKHRSKLVKVVVSAIIIYSLWWLFLAPIEIECGDTYCDYEFGEDCATCAGDCGYCPISEDPHSDTGEISEDEVVSEDGWYDYPFVQEIKSKDFRVVCEEDCPSDADFQGIVDSVGERIEFVEDIVGTKIKEKYMPFEIHATPDTLCNQFRSSNVLAYATIFQYGTGTNGLLCLDAKPLVPDNTVTHELVHLWQFDRFPSPHNSPVELTIFEGFSEIITSLVSSANSEQTFCWDKNSKTERTKDLYETSQYLNGRELFYQLCTKYGFDKEDVPTLFAGIDSWGREVTTEEFINIINIIVKEDTTKDFERHTGYTSSEPKDE